MKVELCSSCLTLNANIEKENQSAFFEDLMKECQKKNPTLTEPIFITNTGCQRLCPLERITMVIYSRKDSSQGQLALSASTDKNDILKEIFSFLSSRTL